MEYKLNLKISKSYFYNPLLLITTLLFVINSGFYIKNYFLICPIYLSFYLATIVVIYIALRSKKIIIPISALLCLLTITYQIFSQPFSLVRIWSVLSSISTISFYLIAILLLKELKSFQVFKISDFFIIYNFLLYLFDTLYRFNLYNFNLVNIFINFYDMKENCLFFGDTNSLGINTTILTFFSYYLFKLTKKNKYKIFIFLFLILTFFSFSRAAILAIFISFILFYSYDRYKNILKKGEISITKIPLSNLISYIWLMGFLLLSIPIAIIIISFLINDGSFLTKIDIFNDIGVFFQKATLSQILFGIGLDNAEAFVGMYAHNYIATYLMETGVIGYTIITTFLLRILYEAPKTIYILLPFSILGISFIGYSILNLFYITLALIIFFEKSKYRKEFNE